MISQVTRNITLLVLVVCFVKHYLGFYLHHRMTFCQITRSMKLCTCDLVLNEPRIKFILWLL